MGKVARAWWFVKQSGVTVTDFKSKGSGTVQRDGILTVGEFLDRCRERLCVVITIDESVAFLNTLFRKRRYFVVRKCLLVEADVTNSAMKKIRRANADSQTNCRCEVVLR